MKLEFWLRQHSHLCLCINWLTLTQHIQVFLHSVSLSVTGWLTHTEFRLNGVQTASCPSVISEKRGIIWQIIFFISLMKTNWKLLFTKNLNHLIFKKPWFAFILLFHIFKFWLIFFIPCYLHTEVFDLSFNGYTLYVTYAATRWQSWSLKFGSKPGALKNVCRLPAHCRLMSETLLLNIWL